MHEMYCIFLLFWWLIDIADMKFRLYIRNSRLERTHIKNLTRTLNYKSIMKDIQKERNSATGTVWSMSYEISLVLEGLFNERIMLKNYLIIFYFSVQILVSYFYYLVSEILNHTSIHIIRNLQLQILLVIECKLTLSEKWYWNFHS